MQDWREQTKACKSRLYLPETKLGRPLNAYWNECCKYSPGCRCWLPQLKNGEEKRGENRVWKMRGWVSWMLLNQMSIRNMQKIRKCSIYKLQWMLFMLALLFLTVLLSWVCRLNRSHLPKFWQGGVCPFARALSCTCVLAQPQLEQLKASVQCTSGKWGQPGGSPRGVFTWASVSTGRIRFF